MIQAVENAHGQSFGEPHALRNSETPIFQQALAEFLSHCERHPFMREEEVLVNEFTSEDLDDTVTNF